MSDESSTVDAGLDELTNDALGITPTESSEAQPQPEPEQTPTVPERPQEPAPTKTSATPTATQPASTPTPQPAPEPTFEIDGQAYTLSQLRAMRTSAQQFPHMQKLYTDQKQREEQAAAQAARNRPAQQLDPAHVRAQIRASFDPSVKEAVAQGFIEEDFTLLYPDLAASMVMNRDALAAVANMVQQQQAKIAAYESQQYAREIRSSIENNMVALSGQHTAFQPLQDPQTREKFFEYLVQIDAKTNQVNDPNFLISYWVAYNKDSYLQGIDAQKTATAQAEATRAAQRRTAQGAALTSSRPGTVNEPKTALDEMVDDFLAPRR